MAVTAIALIGLLVVALILVVSPIRSKGIPKGLRRVPGPKGSPIVGNTLQLQPQPQGQFQQWAREYGEMFQIQMGWENWIFLNTPAAVKDILDRQSAITSGRAPMPVASDLVSGGMRFLLMGYTAHWRKLRTIVHKLLTPKMSDTFRPSQEFESTQLLHDIYSDNQDEESFYMHIRRYTLSVVMTSTYGRRVPKWQSEDVREVYGLMKDFSESAAPGAFIADLIPPLAKIPVWMQWWRARALQYQARQTTIWMKYWRALTQQMEQKRAPECFVKHFIDTDYEKQGISEVQAAFVAGTMIEAGSETTSSALNSALKYLAASPAVQAAADKEISTVIGDSRFPTFADEEQLPYIRAMVKEILRMRPVANIGSPHYTTSDVIYKDYFIPKGTVVTINQYAIHYDPSQYEDPESFKPERFLNHPLKAGAYAAHPDPYQRDHFSFGAGRRICPGLHLAENSLFITLAKILWAFEIRPPVGPDGKEEAVDTSDTAYEDGANTLPKQYKMRFVARSPQRAQVLQNEWDKASREGYNLGNVKVDAAGMVTK